MQEENKDLKSLTPEREDDMDTGTGIAIAGIWLLPTAAVISKYTKSSGVWAAIITASIATYCLV